MIKHVVMWKFKAKAEGADKDANIRKLKAMLEALPAKVRGMESLEVGVDFARSEASWDLVLVSAFQSEGALAAYQEHPEHRKVAEFAAKVRDTRSVVDYRV
ncbi:MAG: Dabb family protein [Pseudomonadota bacterium]